MNKLKKSLVILSFSLVIIGFYISFNFISLHIFKSASQNFSYLKVVNRRPPCLVNVYNFLLETYSQNSSIRIGYNEETVFEHAENTCLSYEQSLEFYTQNPPP